MKKVTLKFNGDKGCEGKTILNHRIGLLRNGTVVDSTGTVIGKYIRIQTDAGPAKDWQEIDFFIGE